MSHAEITIDFIPYRTFGLQIIDFMKKILRQSVRRYLKVKSGIRKEASEIE